MKKLIMITISLMTLLLSGCSTNTIDMNQANNPVIYTNNKINYLYSVIPTQSEDTTLPSYCNAKNYASLPVNTALELTGEENTSCGDYYKVNYNNLDYYILKTSASENKVDTVDYSDYYNHEYMADNIYVDGVVSKEQAEKIYYYLNMIPKDIMEKYDGKIILTTDYVCVLTGLDNYAMTGGYERNSHDIYLSVNDMCSFLHEMGHFFYHMILSDKSGLTELYNQEGQDFHAHYKSSENEFFAECFRRTILEDRNFKENSPNSYEYVNNHLRRKSITITIG